MPDISELQKLVVEFRDERDWQQFHNPKDMAISLSLEAAEVLEHFQWKTPEEINVHLESKKQELSGELADVLYWVLLMSHDMDIDIAQSFLAKQEKNAAKYPIEKAKGSHKKYTEL